ncbi:MAG: hypothetical protein FJW39_03360 [Acidobacteria bacterium]|nr:hypothetical protein [Acidobacteriota bacterium]
MRLAATVLTTAVLFAAPARIQRADLRILEQSFDRRINQAAVEDPFDLLGNTRAIYLEKFGVVLSSEVGLVVSPAPTPFAPTHTKEAKERLRQRKLAHLPLLRRLMRDMMVSSATNLKSMPLEEQVVVGVNLFYQSWEDTTGLPSQIVMQTQRKTLTDFEAGRIKAEALQAAIREQVF